MQQVEWKSRKRVCLGVLIVVVALGLVLGGLPRAVVAEDEQAAEKTGVTDKQILLGTCNPLTGPTKAMGIEEVEGAKLYVAHVNEQGGIHGRKLKLLEYDDQYEPEKAIECFHQLLKDNVFAGICFGGTAPAAKYLSMSTTYHVPLVGFLSGSRILYEPFRQGVFTVRASYSDEITAMVDNLWNVLGIRKIGVLYQNDAFGGAVMPVAKEALKKYGSSPVVLSSYTRNNVDVDRAIEEVRNANPEALLALATYAPLAAFVKRAHAAGVKPLICAGAFCGTDAYIEAAGKDAEGTVQTQVFPSYNRSDVRLIALYRKLLTKYTPARQPTYQSLEGFINAMVAVEGLKRAGRDLTRSKFINALESIHDLDIGLGPRFKLTFGPQRHKALDSVCFTIVREGHGVEFTDWKKLKIQKQ
jgi:branched-chain amino acid transport system substrate-binding protein